MKRYDFTGRDLELNETENGEWVKANEAEQEIKELKELLSDADPHCEMNNPNDIIHWYVRKGKALK
jgi:hypothetical protein